MNLTYKKLIKTLGYSWQFTICKYCKKVVRNSGEEKYRDGTIDFIAYLYCENCGKELKR